MAAYERQERRHLLPWQLQPATCKPGSRANGQTLCLKYLRWVSRSRTRMLVIFVCMPRHRQMPVQTGAHETCLHGSGQGQEDCTAMAKQTTSWQAC